MSIGSLEETEIGIYVSASRVRREVRRVGFCFCLAIVCHRIRLRFRAREMRCALGKYMFRDSFTREGAIGGVVGSALVALAYTRYRLLVIVLFWSDQ